MYSRYSEPNQQVNKKKKMKSYQHNSLYEFLFINFHYVFISKMSEIAAAEFIDVYILTISAHIHCLSLFSNS